MSAREPSQPSGKPEAWLFFAEDDALDCVVSESSWFAARARAARALQADPADLRWERVKD